MKKIVVLSMFVTSIVGGSVYGAKSKDFQRRESLKALEQQKLVTQQRKKLEDNASEMLGKIRASNLSDTEKRTESKKIADQLENLKRADADRVNEILINLEASMNKAGALLQRKLEGHPESADKQKAEGRPFGQATQLTTDVKAGDQASLKSIQLREGERADDREIVKAEQETAEMRRVEGKISAEQQREAEGTVQRRRADVTTVSKAKPRKGKARNVQQSLADAPQDQKALGALSKKSSEGEELTADEQKKAKGLLEKHGLKVGVVAGVGAGIALIVTLSVLGGLGYFTPPTATTEGTPGTGTPSEPTYTPTQPVEEQPEETGMEVVAGRGSYQFED